MKIEGFRRVVWAAPLALLAIGPAVAQVKSKPAKSGAVKTKAAVPATGAIKVDAMLASVFDNVHTLADMHFHKGEYNHIVNLSRMAVAADPSDVDAYSDAAWLLWSMNRDDEAIALYEQGIKANPNSFYMLDELAHYYYNRKKDWPKAIYYYERAASKPDCSELTLHMLAHAYEKNKQLDRALEAWKRVLKHNDAGHARTNYDRIKRLVDNPTNATP